MSLACVAIIGFSCRWGSGIVFIDLLFSRIDYVESCFGYSFLVCDNNVKKWEWGCVFGGYHLAEAITSSWCLCLNLQLIIFLVFNLLLPSCLHIRFSFWQHWEREMLFTLCIFAAIWWIPLLKQSLIFYSQFFHRCSPKFLTLCLVVYHPKLYAFVHILYFRDLYFSLSLLKFFVFWLWRRTHELKSWCFKWYMVFGNLILVALVASLSV